MGRPKKENSRTEIISSRVTKEDKRDFEIIAKLNNMTISQLLLYWKVSVKEQYLKSGKWPKEDPEQLSGSKPSQDPIQESSQDPSEDPKQRKLRILRDIASSYS